MRDQMATPRLRVPAYRRTRPTGGGGASARGRQQGLVLVVVLVVIGMLSLAGFTFAELMFTEHKAARINGRELQAAALIDSGVEMLSALIELPAQQRADLKGTYDNPDRFSGVTVVLPGEHSDTRGRFSIVTYQGEPDGTGRVRHGVEDESARLNLAVLLDWEQREEGAARNALMMLPGMTSEIADAILDWIDPFDEPREFGAEADYYSELQPPYAPSNRTPGALDELLLVRGMTRLLLYGLDTNANGRLDPHELEVDESDPFGARTEAPPRGWAQYLTLHSAEGNLTPQGEPRIDVNAADLSQLHQRLTNALDETWATFIVAARLHGLQQVSATTASNSPPAAASPDVQLDLSQAPRFRIDSLLELINARVVIASPDASEPITLTSPLSGEPATLLQELSRLQDHATARGSAPLVGRINVNLAPREVLLAVPGMNEILVDEIVSKRKALYDPYQPAEMRHASWLLTEGLVTLDEMRHFDAYLTGAGDVFRAQVVGYFDEFGPSARGEVVIDATTRPSRVVSWKDLRHLGRGYTLTELGLAADDFPTP